LTVTELTPLQVRVLGCLIEKAETTPDQYPLTLNALRNACNQKTARHPLMALNEGEVGHTVRELESMKLVREVWGARVAKYEHQAGKTLNLHRKGLALLCPLMLRGAQTMGELKSHSQRLYTFDDLDDVHFALKRLAEHEPSLVMALPKQTGHKEGRYAHLLSGEPDIPAIMASIAVTTGGAGGLADRIEHLEMAVDSLTTRLNEIETRLGITPGQED
jgi:uncharacterized protein YceH (UPF0502 family)